MKSCLNCGVSDWLFQSPQSEFGSCAGCGNRAKRCFLEDSPQPTALITQSAIVQFASLMASLSVAKFETRTERVLRSVLAAMNDQTEATEAFDPCSPKSIVWFVRELERELDSSSPVPEHPIESLDSRTSAELAPSRSFVAFDPGLHLSWASRETFVDWMERGLCHVLKYNLCDESHARRFAQHFADWIEGK